jgi:hypothetical protein
MLFRSYEGKLVELNRYDCKNDHIYYKKILHFKKIINKNPKESTSSTISIQKALLQK